MVLLSGKTKTIIFVQWCLFFVFMEGLNLNNILQYLGVHSAGLLAFIEVAVRIGIVAVIAWATYLIARKWLARVVTKLADKTSTRWDDLMFDQHFFNYFALFITPVVIRLVSDYIGWEHNVIVNKLVSIWVVVAVVLLVSAILDGVNRIYNSYPVGRNRPIKVFIQVLQIFIYCVAVIIVEVRY